MKGKADISEIIFAQLLVTPSGPAGEKFCWRAGGLNVVEQTLVAYCRTGGREPVDRVLTIAYLLDVKHSSPTAARQLLELVARLARTARKVVDRKHSQRRARLSRVTGQRGASRRPDSQTGGVAAGSFLQAARGFRGR